MDPKVKLDDILIQRLGQFGLYQKVHYILLGIPVIFASMHALSWTFTAASVDFRCLYPGENSSAPYEPDTPWYSQLQSLTSSHTCERIADQKVGNPLPTDNASIKYESCSDGYAWDHSDITYSCVERFNLVCHRSIIIATIQALYFVGQLVGSILFGVISDKIGRKPIFIIGILFQLISGACIAFMPWIGAVALFRVALGFLSPAVFIMCVVVGAELVGPRYRMWSAVTAGLFWAIGEMILGALAYPLRDYRYLQLAISLPAIVLLSYWFIFPESARWLLSQGKYDQVTGILNKIAKWNKRQPLPSNWHDQLDTDEPVKLPWFQAIWVLFRTPRLRMRTCISFVIWTAVTMGYYGLAINPAFMGGDNRLGFILSGLLEIPGQLYVLLANILGRKFIAVSGFVVAAICLALTLLVPEHYGVANLLLVVLGKSGLTASFTLVYIWTPEHYPTVIRNTATGACSMAARIGGIAASFISLALAKEYPEAVALTFAILAAVAAVLSLFLPETTGERLLETIEEAEELGRGQPLFILGYKNKKVADERMYKRPIPIVDVSTNQ